MGNAKKGTFRAGRWLKQEGPEPFSCFLPAPLPPEPPIEYSPLLQEWEEKANRALGRLDAVTTLLPDPQLFLYTYVRKEAVLSSQIEGTQSSLSDLFAFENEEEPSTPINDVQEVSNYVAAMQHGLKRLREDNFPLSLRLLREIHGILLREGRGSMKEPGEFRRSQNWIGGSRPGNAAYVPPPPHEVPIAMSALEKYLHAAPETAPTLIKAGLAHAQFESIHPFVDGNGRLGRLLITFILCVEGALQQPLLYLSLYFKENRQRYYDLLQRIRTEGDWEAWLLFYLQGVEAVSTQAAATARELLTMFENHRARIFTLGRASAAAFRVHDFLKERATVSPTIARKKLNLSFPTINAAFKNLEKLGIVKETSGRKTHRLYAYEPYLKILAKGTER